MKTRLLTAIFAAIFTVLGSGYSYGAKTVKIRLTGSTYEPIMMTVGQTGRTEVVSSLPYILEIPKDQLPIKLKFQSETYLYYDIDVPRKPFDTTGHVYLVKINETAMNLRNNIAPSAPTAGPIMGQSTLDGEVKGIDVTHGVNAAPITGRKNENTVALIIANEEYEMAAGVDNATNDGLAFKEYCLKTLGIPGSNIKYAPNVSYGKMKKAISDALDLAELMNGNGNLIFFYAGHGIPDNKTKDAFLMPVDADGTDTEVCMSLAALYNRVNNANINRCVMFLDACFSGAQRGGEMIVAARGVKLKTNAVTPAGKTIVFSATSDDEAAYSYRDEGHGLFTYYLLSKLQQSKGNVNLGELAEFLREKVSLESRRINNNPQTPRVSVSPALADSWKSIRLTK